MEILGLLDHLESLIVDGTKVPFTKKIMINEDQVLSVIDKIRLVIQGGSDFAKKAIGRSEEGALEEEVKQKQGEDKRAPAEAKAVEVLEQAYKMAKEIREGADKYADEVLANLEATSTRILRTIKAGRERLDTTTKVGAEK